MTWPNDWLFNSRLWQSLWLLLLTASISHSANSQPVTSWLFSPHLQTGRHSKWKWNSNVSFSYSIEVQFYPKYQTNKGCSRTQERRKLLLPFLPTRGRLCIHTQPTQTVRDLGPLTRKEDLDPSILTAAKDPTLTPWRIEKKKNEQDCCVNSQVKAPEFWWSNLLIRYKIDCY